MRGVQPGIAGVDPLLAADVLAGNFDQHPRSPPADPLPAVARGGRRDSEPREAPFERCVHRLAIVAIQRSAARSAQRLASGLVHADRGRRGVGRARTGILAQRFDGLDLDAHERVDHCVDLSVFEHIRPARLDQSDEVVGEAGPDRGPPSRLGHDVCPERESEKRFPVDGPGAERHAAAEGESRAPAGDVGDVRRHVRDLPATRVSRDVPHSGPGRDRQHNMLTNLILSGNGSGGRDRTYDQLINSQLLYR